MADFLAAAGFIGRTVAAGRGGLADRHKRLRNVEVAGVKLQPPAGDGVVSLQHQGVFNFRFIDKLFQLREEVFDVLVHTQPDAGGVDADIGDIILLRQVLMASASARKSIPRHWWRSRIRNLPPGTRRCHEHAPGAVAVLRSIRGGRNRSRLLSSRTE